MEGRARKIGPLAAILLVAAAGVLVVFASVLPTHIRIRRRITEERFDELLCVAPWQLRLHGGALYDAMDRVLARPDDPYGATSWERDRAAIARVLLHIASHTPGLLVDGLERPLVRPFANGALLLAGRPEMLDRTPIEVVLPAPKPGKQPASQAGWLVAIAQGQDDCVGLPDIDRKLVQTSVSVGREDVTWSSSVGIEGTTRLELLAREPNGDLRIRLTLGRIARR